MLSVLIPTYNYNVFPLVKELHTQCVACTIDFEIICFDDASELFIEENKNISTLSFCRVEFLEKNAGRSMMRNSLAEAAKYDWLLFLDADTLPVKHDFIANYVHHLSGKSDIIYGGILYESATPEKQNLLRWVYGRNREALPVHKREKHPYLSFLTLNFFIRKTVFEQVKFNEALPNLRHDDTLFSFELKQTKIPLQHIENPVYHLGLETSEVFLKKSQESVTALQFLMEQELIDMDYLKLSRYFNRIRKSGMRPVFTFIFVSFGKRMQKNLVSGHPNLFLFDLYRLSYLCYLYKK